jgi:hypothetical protein
MFQMYRIQPIQPENIHALWRMLHGALPHLLAASWRYQSARPIWENVCFMCWTLLQCRLLPSGKGSEVHGEIPVHKQVAQVAHPIAADRNVGTIGIANTSNKIG